MNWLRACVTAPAAAGVFICAVLALAGCATPQVSQLEADWPAQLPALANIDNVPFFAQEKYQCGPAALAMVAQAAGAPVQPEDLVDQVYLPARQGSLQVEMLAAGRRHGLLTYQLAPRLDAVLREVANGNPVLVLQNLTFSFAPLWHYAVVIGFDRNRNTIVLHSGVTERIEMSLFTFERTWARGEHWAMLALQPSRLPATAEPLPYVRAAAALERVQPAAARTAYTTALKAWPGLRSAMLGVGNAAYAMGQLDQAATAYRAAVLQHADFADAWNNLAQVLFELGRTRQAQEAINKAIALDGARLPLYLELQQKIEAQLQKKSRASPRRKIQFDR